jgi:2-polyprenyl-6-methoxyphenol hydroxylase-like FAD-dependent oxidoreductase
VTKAIVVGGGIGGVTAGIALEQAGVETVVFERTTEYKERGTGLHIAINAMRALRELGLAEAVVERAGTPVERMQFLDYRGRRLMEWPVSELSARYGVPACGVTRPTLHGLLVDAFPGTLHLGTEVSSFRQDADGVTVRLADGREERGDLLVGADGIWSKTRIALLGDGEPRYAGYLTTRAVVDADEANAPPGLFRQFWGRGTVFIFYRVGEGRLYWVAATRLEGNGNGEARLGKQALLDRYREFVDPVSAIIEQTPEDVLVPVDAKDRDPAKRWGEGRVTLLGDAAHPMSPTQGQGACQAIEDAVELGKSLRGAGDVAAALRGYEQRRIPRTAKFVRQARVIGKLGCWENPVAVGLRNQIMRRSGKAAYSRAAKEMGYEFES